MMEIERVREAQNHLFAQLDSNVEDPSLLKAVRPAAERAAKHVARLRVEAHRDWLSTLLVFYGDSDASLTEVIWSLTDDCVAKANGTECLPVVLTNSVPVATSSDTVVTALRRGHFLLGFVTVVTRETGVFPSVEDGLYNTVGEIFVLPDVWASQERRVRSIFAEAVIL